MNIYDKTNKSIADVAAKVMSETPAKVQDYKPVEPLDNTLVDQVVKAGMNTRFNSLKEDVAQDDPEHVQAKVKLDHTPVWPKAKAPLEHNKTSSSSAEDGTINLKNVTTNEEALTHMATFKPKVGSPEHVRDWVSIHVDASHGPEAHAKKFKKIFGHSIAKNYELHSVEPKEVKNEDTVAGLINNYALNLPPPVQTVENKKMSLVHRYTKRFKGK